MLRFSVHSEGGPAPEWPLVNAHLLGPGDVPIPGKVAFREGEIGCRGPVGQASALCLQYDAGPAGRLMLQTCLLPERDVPYVLTVELARHRIKSFIAKSEEWQLFDLGIEHPAMRKWDEARQRLTAALTTADRVRASAIARDALALAIEATERLAMAHAEILLHRRFGQRAASSATLGARMWPGRDGRALRELIAKSFDVLVMPLRWRSLEVEEGVFNWEPVDRWMEWAKGEGKPIIAGPLIDLSTRALPDWMSVWQHDYSTCRDLVYEYMERVVVRYRSHVGMWNLVSGLNLNDNIELSSAQMLDLTRTASLLVRQARHGARTMIELREPFGEHTALRPSSVAPVAFVDQLLQEGIKFDALGVQILFGEHGCGRATRDLMQVSSLLDRFFLHELPVLVSALGVPTEPIDPDGGTWQQPWSPDVQSKWVTRLFPILLSKPFVESIFWTDLYDHPDAELPCAGLINDAGKPKPALAKLVGMRRRLRKPLGPLKVTARSAET